MGHLTRFDRLPPATRGNRHALRLARCVVNSILASDPLSPHIHFELDGGLFRPSLTGWPSLPSCVAENRELALRSRRDSHRGCWLRGKRRRNSRSPGTSGKPEECLTMAKRQKRSSRETKKPKAAKKPVGPATATLRDQIQSTGSPLKRGGK